MIDNRRAVSFHHDINNLAALHQWPSKVSRKAVKSLSSVFFPNILYIKLQTARVLQGTEVRLQEVFLMSAAILNWQTRLLMVSAPLGHGVAKESTQRY